MLVPSPVPVEVMAWCWRDVVRLSVDPTLKVDPKQLQVRMRQCCIVSWPRLQPFFSAVCFSCKPQS